MTLRSVSHALSRRTPWPVTEAACAADALALLSAAPYRLVISDVRMPGMDGLALLREVGRMKQAPPVVMMTAYGTIELAVECLKRGAYDFLTKPVELDQLAGLVQSALGCRESEADGDSAAHLCGLIGASQAMREVFRQIRALAAVSSTVLVTGESGTGKELVSRAIHTLSERRHKKLVVVNCPAIPESMLESELFGHTCGAFTNAVTGRQGLIEEADGGTLVLDEIGDLPLPLQAKILRVLEDREVRPVGSNKARQVNVRVIAVTNQNPPGQGGRGALQARPLSPAERAAAPPSPAA